MKKVIYVFILLCGISACHNNHDHDNTEEEGHDHGDVSESYTKYSENFELFVEFNPFVVGEKSEFLAYYTWLDNFKPVTEGELIVSFIQGDKIVSNTVKTPIRPGIFNTGIEILLKGVGDLVFELRTNNISEKIIIKNVVAFEDDHDAIHAIEEKDTIKGISFLKEQVWQINFKVLKIGTKEFRNVIKTSGEIIPSQGSEMQVSAKSSGNFIFGETLIFPGVYLNKGDLIGFISGGSLIDHNPKEHYLKVKAEYEKAEKDFDRAKKLVAENIISEKEYQDYLLKYKKAKISHDLFLNNFSDKGIKIIAPVSGVIKEVEVSGGNYVNSGSNLITILENKRVIIRADVSQEYYSELNNLKSANFMIPGLDKVFDTELLDGKILSYGKNRTSGYLIPVFIEINNTASFLSGSFVEVYLKGEVTKNAIVVPNSSILEEQGNYFVFAQLGGETYEKKYVVPGQSDGKYTQILSGLNEGERIVTQGAVRVKLASMSTALPAQGHAH